MRNLLKNLEELEGKTIESVILNPGYSSEVVIKTNDNCILVLSTTGNWDRCGDFEGCSIDIETSFSYYGDKERLNLLTEEDIEKNLLEEEKKEKERMRKELEEKRKADEAAEKMRKSELELLAKLKEKYEK